MTDLQHRRRASDRAQERAQRAQAFGDHAAVVMATAQLESALRRRAEWADREILKEASEAKANAGVGEGLSVNTVIEPAPVAPGGGTMGRHAFPVVEET